ncbi:hypothetical protein Y1Q_0022396 [Alligator mississippiensis]|uniref:Uncharacterized protein n=1 Tax=Alligator mississippiensis TaxID=8496 RepID=A0A151P0T2_ALLMI|nr:hypothetical protein Y1Q_0022396 [Alligator mississippiensis]
MLCVTWEPLLWTRLPLCRVLYKHGMKCLQIVVCLHQRDATHCRLQTFLIQGAMRSIQFCPLKTITPAKLSDAILSLSHGTTLLTSLEELVNSPNHYDVFR